jgi:hypothetical protein
MQKTINERWVQLAYFSAKGDKIYKTAFKFQFHTDLEIDREYPIPLLGQTYLFTCVGQEYKTNNDDTVDVIYLVSSTAV